MLESMIHSSAVQSEGTVALEEHSEDGEGQDSRLERIQTNFLRTAVGTEA